MASSPSQLAVPSLAGPSLDSSAGFQFLVAPLPGPTLQPAAYPWGQTRGPAGEGEQLLILGWMDVAAQAGTELSGLVSLVVGTRN